MAVAPTGAIYKALKFGGVSSRTYGVYITGEAVYNAPERDVEMITIPGRNGSFALDNGRFQNIEVSYPAGIFADTEVDFRQAISDFRNFLCSRNGYVRLQDEYNPDEYRMAVYKSGLEVDPAMLKAGEFKIVFDCKPQRYLTSGETKQTIASSGDTITNPTLFDASPLLEITGHGDVGLGSETVTVYNQTLGRVVLADAFSTSTLVITANLRQGLLAQGDAFTVSGVKLLAYFSAPEPNILNFKLSIQDTENIASYEATTVSATSLRGTITLSDITFTYGTAFTAPTAKAKFRYSYDKSGSSSVSSINPANIVVDYDGADTLTITLSGGITTSSAATYTLSHPDILGESTISTLTVPVYVDLDIGEAYGYVGSELQSLNNSVQIPANIPALSPGANTITFDNTVTDLKITPRWWKI